jgi:glycosyltransferase involved in cell wall biosynthesis
VPAPADRLVALAVAGTHEDAPEAVADLEALVTALGTDAPCATLLAGAPAQLARQIPPDGSAIARIACATETVPEAWVRALQRTDAVWVPGAFSRASLVRSGVTAERVQVVAPVVDVERFSPDGPAKRVAGARSFVFLAPLDWTRASGWDVLLRAWAEEFAPDEDVTLAIRAWSTLGYGPQHVADALHGELDALGHDPARLADLIVEVDAAHAAPTPEAYRGADCVVAPARGDAWGRTLLEAMACGLPLIATDYAAGADLCAPGCAFSVPAGVADIAPTAARELPPLTGLRWGEPDAGALRRLMRAAFADRGAAAATAARGRAHVLEHHALQRGTAAPSGSAARRRPTTKHGSGARAEDVSFVVQGPVERSGRGRTARVCEAIRAHFPGAEIVISTWAGTDTSRLDCDVVVHSEDPGVVGPCTYNVNTNRQIVSSLAGVRASTRPLVAKIRSDMLFVSDTLLSYWGRWEERTDELRLFERRVLVPNIFARRPSHLGPYPLHLSDWGYFGTRADLELLFDVPAMTLEQSLTDGPLSALARTYYVLESRPSYTPEQWIWTQALRNVAPDTALEYVFDLTPQSLRQTELSFANNVAILDTYTQYGVWCPKYPAAGRLFEDVTLFSHEQWLELYDIHCRARTIDRGDVAGLVRAFGRGDISATPADAVALRRAGLAWEAQLLECILTGARVSRDSTTGGTHRWHLDSLGVKLARDELVRSAGAQLGTARGNSRSGSATAAGPAGTRATRAGSSRESGSKQPIYRNS